MSLCREFPKFDLAYHGQGKRHRLLSSTQLAHVTIDTEDSRTYILATQLQGLRRSTRYQKSLQAPLATSAGEEAAYG